MEERKVIKYFVLFQILNLKMEDNESDLECSICNLKSCKTGNHYGAVTCYPCRSFFRRTPERKRAPRCKFDGSCLVDHSVKVHCPGCRYNKCLR